MSELPGIVPQPYALDEKARSQIAAMLDIVAQMKRPCVKCGRMLWFVKTKMNRLAPYTDDAINHFADCSHAASFKGKGERR